MNRVKFGQQSMLYPYPVTILSTVIEGRKNFMQVGFSGIVNANPGMVALGVAKNHHTTTVLKEGCVIGLSLANQSMLLKADYVGIRSGKKVDKSHVFKTFEGGYGATLIEEAPVTMELRIKKVLDLGGVDNIIISEILEVHVMESVITGKYPDIEKMKPLVFSMYENRYFNIGQVQGKGWHDGLMYEKLNEFVIDIFRRFDVLADVESFDSFIDDESVFVFDDIEYKGFSGFCDWYGQINESFVREGMSHSISEFDAKKIDDNHYSLQFNVHFSGTTQEGHIVNLNVKESWHLRLDGSTFIFECYLAKAID